MNDDLYGVVVSVGLGVVLLHGLMISWVGEQFRVADVDGIAGSNNGQYDMSIAFRYRLNSFTLLKSSGFSVG